MYAVGSTDRGPQNQMRMVPVPNKLTLPPATVTLAEAMKAAGDELMPQARSMFVEGTSRFFHRGESGRWQDLFTAQDLAAYAGKARTELPPGLDAWLASGRRGAGDPRTSAD